MENVFNIKYDSKLDKVKMPKDRYMNKIFKVIQKNKFITLVFSSFIALSMINFYLIYSFMKILENIWKNKNNVV